jgi:ribosomal protein S18 acetylase RimI-like enzyme
MKVQYFNEISNPDELSKIVFLNFIQLKGQPNIEFSQDAIRKTLTSPDLKGWFILSDDNKTIGYLFGKQMRMPSFDGRLVYFMDYFWLEPEYRGQGIGKSMLNRCIKFVRNCNIQFIMLITKKNEPAYQMYKKYGFLKDTLIKFDNPEYELLSYYTY